MRKEWYIIMGKMIVYEAMNEHTFKHHLYVIDENHNIEDILTTYTQCIPDICQICRNDTISTIHLYGPQDMLTFMKHQILTENLKFNHKDIEFIFN